MRLDPFSLPVRFDAHDTRADGGLRQVELHRERVVLRRAVQGMRMAVEISVSNFRGIALRESGDAQMLVLTHRDPSLNIPLHASSNREEIAAAWQTWSDIFALPRLEDGETGEPSPRRRRRNAISWRRPRFLMRRRSGDQPAERNVHRGEREIIAPE
jgi:Family of unknown function (DUF6101)